MPKIIHPEPTEKPDESEVFSETDTVVSFTPDSATEEHLNDLFMAETLNDGSTYWQQEEQQRRKKLEELFGELDIPVPAELLKQRKAYGEEGKRGKMLPYVTWSVIVRRLNHYFGHDGWTTDIKAIQTFGEESGKPPRFVSAVVVLTVRWPTGGTSTFTNTGSSVTGGSNWGSFEMAYKGAVSDGIKRCATALGDAFGLALYDDDAETAEVEEMTEGEAPDKKVTPLRPKPKAEYPIATEDDVFECENCGREIKGYTAQSGKSYTTAQLVNYSKRDADGHIFCYSCKQEYLKAKQAR